MAPSSLGKAKKGRSTSSVKPTASTSTAQSTPAADSTLHQIQLLTSQLPPSAPSNSSLNPLADLCSLFTAIPLTLPSSNSNQQQKLQANRQQTHSALHSLKAIFETLIQQGRLHGTLKAKKGKMSNGVEVKDETVEKVKAWLNQRWAEFLKKASQVVQGHWDPTVRLSALSALMSLLRLESTFLTSLHHSRQAQFPSATFAHIVRAILVPLNLVGDGLEGGEIRPEIKEEWLKYWNRDDDIRYYFMKEAATLMESLRSSPPASLTSNYITFLESLTSMPTSPHELNSWWCATPLVLKAPKPAGSKKRKPLDDPVGDGSTGVFDSSSESEAEPEQKLSSSQTKKLLPPLLSLPAHRKVFQAAFLALLALPMEEAEQKRVLVILHRQVLPHLTEPRRCMDWLVDCGERGGTVGILALNGLFTLMQKHNLEFPDFFSKLYALLDRDVLHVRYRPRFFRLLDVFMGSSHLPSNLIASFIKRLARLSLSAPPAGIVTIIPFIYNMLKRHPSCMGMIHRPARDEEVEERTAENDPFLASERDPLKTHATESSLWELKALQSHYLASVSGLAKIFNEVMNKQSYAMEDFLDHSYGTMFESETSRVIRSAPALAPVPKRQPIGDSFFPSLTAAPKAIEPKEGEDAEEKADEEPVDNISAMWGF